MSVCGIYNNDVHMRVDKCIYTIHHIARDADTGSTEQTALCILCAERIFDLFFNVFDRDETFQIVFCIHDGEFLFSCLCEDLFCLFQSDAFACGDQILGGHALLDLLCEICLKLQVAVGDDSNELAFSCDRDTGDAELAHQIVCVL